MEELIKFTCHTPFLRKLLEYVLHHCKGVSQWKRHENRQSNIQKVQKKEPGQKPGNRLRKQPAQARKWKGGLMCLRTFKILLTDLLEHLDKTAVGKQKEKQMEKRKSLTLGVQKVMYKRKHNHSILLRTIAGHIYTIMIL